MNDFDFLEELKKASKQPFEQPKRSKAEEWMREKFPGLFVMEKYKDE